jgi:hypothetical protein
MNPIVGIIWCFLVTKEQRENILLTRSFSVMGNVNNNLVGRINTDVILRHNDNILIVVC